MTSPSAVSSEGLSYLVERHLRSYFEALDGVVPSGDLYAHVLAEIERPLLRLTLEQCGWNQLRAAAILGLNRNTLRKKISDLGLDIPKNQSRKTAA